MIKSRMMRRARHEAPVGDTRNANLRVRDHLGNLGTDTYIMQTLKK
jgi:hypothetical protein